MSSLSNWQSAMKQHKETTGIKQKYKKGTPEYDAVKVIYNNMMSTSPPIPKPTLKKKPIKKKDNLMDFLNKAIEEPETPNNTDNEIMNPITEPKKRGRKPKNIPQEF